MAMIRLTETQCRPRPEGHPYSVEFFEQYETFEDFCVVVEPLCRELCVKGWVLDYFAIHFQSKDDAMLVAMAG
jgi:hypothetical protein